MTRPYTPEELLELIIPHLDQRKLRRRVTKDGKQVQARCPFHDDDEPSLSLTIKNGKLLANCFVCGKVYDRLLKLAGVQPATARPIAPRSGRTGRRGTAPYQPVRLAELADAKGLDAEKLRAWHVHEIPAGHAPEAPNGGLAIPYLTREGELHAINYRRTLEKTDANKDPRFKWRTGDKKLLYGLWRLPEWGDADTIYLCEGESDTWSLWHAGLAALGVPSASVWKSKWWDEVEAFERIVLIADADGAGAGLVEKLALSCPEHLRERVYVLRLPDGVKDANELWQRVDADPERFREALGACEIILLTDSYRNQNSRINDDLPQFAPLGEILASHTNMQVAYVPLLGYDGLIARGAITLLAAHPKAGKTTLLAHACKEWVQRGLEVMYLSEESALNWSLRAQLLPELTQVKFNLDARAHPERWAAAIHCHAPDIVVIDTARRFAQISDENDAAAVAGALSYFVDLRHALPNTAIVLVHHTRKSISSDGEITDIAGSHAFTAEADAILLLSPNRDHRRQRVVVPVAGRLWNTTHEPFVVELSEDGREYRVVGTVAEVLPATREQTAREKILDALRVLGKATAEEVAEYLRSSGEAVASSHVRNLLTELVQEGMVEREGDGKRGNPYTYSVYSSVLNPLRIAQQNNNPAPTDGAPDYSSVLNPIGIGQQNNNPADPVEPPPALPDLFTNRAPLSWDLIDDYLQSASNPDDPFGLEPSELDAIRVMLAYAEARGFPALVVDGYTIHGDMAGWLTAAQQLAGTPAVARATRLLHALDGAGDPATPTHNTTLRNGDAGLTPSQLSFEEA